MSALPVEQRLNQPNHIPTANDLIELHGDPAQGAGNKDGAPSYAARTAAEGHREAVQRIADQASAERRDLTDAETRAFDKHASQIRLLDALADGYGQRAATEGRIRAESGHVGPGSEYRTMGGAGYHIGGGNVYRKGDVHGPSWVRDLVNFGMRGDPEAAERLHRNNREVAVETRALTTTDGAGGDFVPPLYLVQQYVEMARAARITANLVRQEVLPPGTDSINLPKVVTGTAVAEQATQNTAVQNTDATTGTVTANVATIAGQQVVALQLIEQSPVNTDQILLQDLIADLANKIDLYVIQNNAANKKGLLNATGINAVTYTDATPTVGELFPKVADARRLIEVNRFMSPTAIVMSPLRWAWHLAAVDTAGRPLVVPDASGPYNALGNSSGVTDPSTGRVGTMLGLPVYVDPLIPTNLGGGTNEDRVIVFRAEDSTLYEGMLNAEAFRAPNAANLSVVLRVYKYIAFTAERLPKSVSVVSGTGLIQPVL